MADRRNDVLAKNEVLFREVNEQVDRIDREHGVPGDELASFLCECSRVECLERVTATPAEYEEVRSTPHAFLLVHGHEMPDVETVVRSTDRFVVVEKHPGRTRDPARDGSAGASLGT